MSNLEHRRPNIEPQVHPPVPLFYRFLHRAYSRGAQLSQFVQSRVAPAGWGVLGLLVMTAVLGADVSRSALYQIFALSLALLAVGLLWAWARRARLTARRVLPRYATAGEECRVTIEITNRGRRAVRGVLIRDRVPDPRPDLRQFAFTPEPGEAKRNAFDRLFVYYRWRWLLDRRLLFTGGRCREVLSLKPGQSARVSVALRARRRGAIRFNDLRAVLPDPLGLFQRNVRVEAPEDTLHVLPRRYRLPAVDLPGEACFQLGGEALSNTIGQSGEFLGLRDYRPGDALRHIHWKSWAKTGRPIVKEFEEVFFPRYGLVLETFAAPGDEDLFEETVSVAASFAAAIDTNRSLLDLMFIKDKAIIVTAGRGVAKTEKLLEVLAAVEADPAEHFHALLQLVQRYRDDLTSCICLFTGWSETRAGFLRGVLRHGLETTALVVCRDEARVRDALQRHPVPCRLLPLELSRIQEGLLKL